jgi:pimeloyl-ACP methyl ester carboxylesterase
MTADDLQPLKTARAGVLEVAYHEASPADGEAVLLLHGFPYTSTATSTSFRCSLTPGCA